MREDILSRGQWGALLWAAALAPAVELLPGTAVKLAGRGAWLSPVSAALILLPLLWLGRRGDGRRLRADFSGKIILGVLALWMELLVVLRLALCARRMLWAGERDGAVWYFLLTLAALALWMGQGRLAAFGRTGQLFLVLLLVAAVLVLGLSVPLVRADRVLPVWTGDVPGILRAGVTTAGTLCWAVLPMLLLPAQERRGKNILLWGAGGCVVLTLAQFILLGNLGPGLSARSESAFFALTKSVGIEGAFQRVEGVVSAVWMLSDLTACVALTHVIGLAGEGVVFHVKRETVSSLALLTGTAGGLWLVRRGLPVESWNRDWVWLGNLLACALACLGLKKSVSLGKKTKTE